MKSKYKLIIAIVVTLVISNPKIIYDTYSKIAGTPTYHKVTEYKFVDDFSTDLKYLDPETKREKRVWFWWWFSTPKFYDVSETSTEYVEWTQNNLFYTDVKQHLKMSAWKKKDE